MFRESCEAGNVTIRVGEFRVHSWVDQKPGDLQVGGR